MTVRQNKKQLTPALIVAALLMFGTVVAVFAADLPPHSSLVYPGVDGNLVYTADAQGNRIPDYSYAGYGGGGLAIPFVPAVDTLWAVEGDAAPVIQAAIDRVSALPLDENGFRGALLLMAGRYVLDSPVSVSTSGVVLRGEGQGDDGTVLFGAGAITGRNTQEHHFESNFILFHGASNREEDRSRSVEIADAFLPFGARTFQIEGPHSLRVGDRVIVRRRSNDEWFAVMGEGNRVWRDNTRTIAENYDFDRTIVAIEGDRITIDAPLTIPVEARFGGGEVVPYDDPGRIRHSGIENLRIESDFDRSVRTTAYGNMDRPSGAGYYGEEYFSDEDHYWNGVHMDNAVDCWVRNVTAMHFAGSVVFLGEGCMQVTVADCTSLDPVSQSAGWRRYTFQICGQRCLMMRCVSEKGRHTFILGGFQTCGPNVFLDCEERQGYGSSEPHMCMVTGSLYDNVHTAITLRKGMAQPYRWMSIWGLLWNCEGMFRVQQPPAAQNFAIGQVGIHSVPFNRNLMDDSIPRGFIESWDRHVGPRSLYLQQLEDRLGVAAVRNMGYE